ncbi:MAG: GNAT family N-acetyltransferase [Spirochaetes bacterium]|nr:GNAT family N-acetyltransferase [Spirochaetota bacterium]MBU1079266.1 GNAT family N-acetyltransferase [Spirochaetota bacterium]
MTTIEIRALYDEYERRNADYPGYRREETDKTVRMVNDDEDGHNYLVYSSLSHEGAEAAIDGELAYFRGLRRSFEWKLYSHDEPADLKARLAARGFSIGEDEAIMALELAELPPELAADNRIDARRVSDEEGLAAYAALDALVWPDDHEECMRELTRTFREEPGRQSLWLASIDGVPACAARIDFPPRSPFASLWGGATLEAYRGRGAYTALLAARAKEALARGYRFLTIDASPMSRPIVARRGFRLLSVSNPCDSPPE